MAKKPKILTCQTCGVEFEHTGVGRNPLYCPTHRSPKNLYRDLQRAENSGDQTKAKSLRQAHAVAGAKGEGPSAETVDAIRKASEVERMAVGLAMAGGNHMLAATLAGIEGDAERLTELAELARERHSDLMELRPQSISRVLRANQALLALHTRALIPTFRPQQIPNAMRVMGQVDEQLTGGTDAVYSAISMEVVAPTFPEEEDEDGPRESD